MVDIFYFLNHKHTSQQRHVQLLFFWYLRLVTDITGLNTYSHFYNEYKQKKLVSKMKGDLKTNDLFLALFYLCVETLVLILETTALKRARNHIPSCVLVLAQNASCSCTYACYLAFYS